MVFRRRPSTPEPAPLRPEWQRRFDAAAEIIRSQPGPDWIDDRLAAHEAALRSAEVDDRRLAASIERLRPDATAAELEQALRRRGPTPSPNEDDPVERQIVALRRRYETTHDLINRRDAIAPHVATTVSDLELLAVQAVYADAVLGADPSVGLDSHLERLDIDLRALARARLELEQL